ncbi:MAG: FAD-dependent oxidoreductase [Nitratireductor sp.]|nr:FAD-dependent oxidoreductase [Nitratireductor sp.]MCC0021187.1 FAD-dependent oxidoreductase [Nitratireductor sp.]
MASEARSGKGHAAIIGAGIVGVSTAIWLQRAGWKVTLFDGKGIGEATSFGNGGVLASCAVVPVTGPGLWAKAPAMLFSSGQPLFMKWGYLPRLAPWLMKYMRHCNAADTRRIAAALAPIISDSLADHEALARGTVAEKYLHPSDYVYVYNDRSEFESEAFSWSIRSEYGFQWDELSGPSLRVYLPQLAKRDSFGIRLKNHGRISDPGAYVKALAEHVISQGGEFVQTDVSDIEISNGEVTGIVTTHGLQKFDKVVLNAGVWSAKLMKRLGIDVPLESERGYHMELWDPSETVPAPLMISAGKFVVTPMDGRIRLAGILEFGGLDAAPSEAPYRLLEKKFRDAFPKISWKQTTRWMGHRPATSDSIPVIGELPGAKGVFAGFGHHHVGLTGGPATGRLLSQIIDGAKPNIDLEPYSPLRFK